MENSKGLCSEPVFRQVFESQFKLLRNFLIYKYRDAERAEDTAQNAFVVLWENCDAILPEQARSYLFTTAIRMSLNAIKHDKVRDDFKLISRADVEAESPEFLAEHDELRIRLEHAINRLPEKQRVVFLMNRFESLSYNEIATLLDISVKAVEKRMHNALIELRKIARV
jgi:RNA polymerase sigma factor (sigma-70 family)